MTMTPNLIVEFLAPWALALLTYPILRRSARCIVVSGGRAAASAVTPLPHERFFTSRDVASAGILSVAGWMLGSTIQHLVPGHQWWAQPLTTGWEIGYAIAMVVVAVAAPLLYVAAALLTFVVLLMLVTWLGEPIDGEPGSLTRMRTMWRVVATVWSKVFGRFNSVTEAARS
ncbi:hypothetical protein [Mycolicibacterium sp. J2]|uniref:hypothetical protein n=1 Tax=Mycolicibacterium sp. J2 TaxID=2993511 RepID=UPI00224AAE6E|nr:hypothetical protein [Mycolicibacterium sp. J2]MCX2715645.1 hypothetical protein [Mycolicibacterium sp. J2]